MRIRSGLLLTLLLGALSPLQAEILYNVTALTPSNIRSFGYGINDQGQVTGYNFQTAPGGVIYRAFLASEGQITDLGDLGGGNSRGFGLNNIGQVVGDSYTSANYNYEHAFLYSQGQMTDLGILKGWPYSSAYGINDQGRAVGIANGVAVLYSNGQITDLGMHPGSAAYAINNAGQITGIGAEFTHAFLYTDSQVTDLGTLGGPFSFGYGINDRGQVVGESDTSDGPRHAFLYKDGQMVDLGTLGKEAGRVAGGVIGLTANKKAPARMISPEPVSDLSFCLQ